MIYSVRLLEYFCGGEALKAWMQRSREKEIHSFEKQISLLSLQLPRLPFPFYLIYVALFCLFFAIRGKSILIHIKW